MTKWDDVMLKEAWKTFQADCEQEDETRKSLEFLKKEGVIVSYEKDMRNGRKWTLRYGKTEHKTDEEIRQLVRKHTASRGTA